MLEINFLNFNSTTYDKIGSIPYLKKDDYCLFEFSTMNLDDIFQYEET